MTEGEMVAELARQGAEVTRLRVENANLSDRLREAKADALREAADAWPIGVCAHRCFREDEHVAPKDCLLGPDWLTERADSLGETP